jgi:hypothetical protein
MKKCIHKHNVEQSNNKRVFTRTALFDFSENFKYKNEFPNYRKVEKFDDMCEEYVRLMNYRQMLYVMMAQNSVSVEENENGMILQKIRKLSTYDASSIHSEISSLNIIISWLEALILDEPNLTQRTEKDENTGNDKF